MKRHLLSTLLIASLVTQPLAPAFAQSGAGQASGGQAPDRQSLDGQSLDIQNADIRAFIQDVARATGTTFIVDPRVQGTVNVNRGEPMSGQELLGVLLAVLRANGLVAVPAGAGAYRVVPDDTAAQQPASAGGAASGFATQVIPLRTVDARIAAETLKPLVGRGGVVLPMPQGNSLLVADYADNLRRIRELIAQVDSDRATIDTVTLRNSSAQEIAATVNRLFGGGADGVNPALSVLPVGSSNSIVVRGDAQLIQRVVQMILELDRRAESSGDVRVVKLRHANAEQLLPVLQQLIGQPAEAAPQAADAAPSNAVSTAAADGAQVIAGRPGKRPTIVRYPGSNSLIINADPETQRTLLDVIEQLDTRREQVLVEAIVVEISDEAAKELGVQFLLGGKDGNIPFLATQYPSSKTGIMPIAAGVAAGEPGDDDDDDGVLDLARRAAVQSLLGLSGGLAGLAGSNGDAVFGMIINAVKSDTGSNLLSTPSIMTLDNEEARILVGQEVPITTGEVLGDANSNPFRTIQRQDVGVQLEVKPQINAGGGITLFLRQEVSSIAGPVSADFNELVLNKREIETKVQVDDGAIVVLGGLLDQTDRLTVDKIPGLGDLPLVGGLFRSTARANNKRNLMVFIRPTVIRNAADAHRETAYRYGYIRDRQLESQQAKEQRAALDALVQEYLRMSPPVQPPLPSTPPVPAEGAPSSGQAAPTR